MHRPDRKSPRFIALDPRKALHAFKQGGLHDLVGLDESEKTEKREPVAVPGRPRMVMAVGNAVTGDSRVEKMALTASNAGYEVIVVGMKHRTTFTYGTYSGVPIYRPTPDWTDYLAWRNSQPNRLEKAEDQIEEQSEEVQTRHAERTETLHRNAAIISGVPRLLAPSAINVDIPLPVKTAQKALDKLAGLERWSLRPQLNWENRRMWVESTVPGAWRNLWKQIEGFEALFLEAFRELRPDIIHVHDRHPMSAARLYAEEEQTRGRTVPWIYDAHEFLPGQRFSGPPNHRIGWLAMEKEMIGAADAVVTVSTELAETLRVRHGLPTLPSVVANAPSISQHLNPEPGRESLREEIGLDPDTPLLVYVGKLALRRGIFTAADALGMLPGVHLAFVASPDVAPREELRERAARVGASDRIHIVDYVPSRNVTSYISSATIGISPLYATPAHHSALATKIREYLQAGLPIVGTDLRVQGAFIREHDIGATHREQDPKDFARAIRETLARIDVVNTNVSPELRSQHSWEKQEKVLRSVWGSLVSTESTEAPDPGPGSPAPMFTVQDPALARFIRVADSRGYGVAVRDEGVLYCMRPGGQVWDRLTFPEDDKAAAIKEWAVLTAKPGVIVTRELKAVLPASFAPDDDQAALLAASGQTLLYFAEPGHLDNPEEHRTRLPFSFWADYSEAAFDRTVRQRRRVHNLLKDLGIRGLTSQPPLLGNEQEATWLPLPAERGAAGRDSATRSGRSSQRSASGTRKLRIGVIDTQRAKADVAAVGALMEHSDELSIDKVVFGPSPSDDVDIVIDTLSTGFYTQAGLEYLAAGTPVVSYLDPEVTANISHEVPVFSTPPASLLETLKLVVEKVHANEAMAASSTAYVKEVHGDHAVVKVLDSLARPR